MADGRARVAAFAPATVANVGCGFDVLGFAIETLGDLVEARVSDELGVRVLSIEGDGGVLPKDPARNTAAVAAAEVLARAGGRSSGRGLELKLVKKMPLASGLGSSAASSVAGAVAANAILGEPLSKPELLACAVEGERAAVGTPHADNVAPSLFGGFVLVRGGERPRVDAIPVPDELTCALIHPHLEVNTKEARAVLPREIPLASAVVQWGNVAALVAGLATSDWELIASAGADVIVEPLRKSFVPGFERAKEAALAAGALGCSLSGSGPSIFALCRGRARADDVAEAMRAAFTAEGGVAADVLVSKVGARGARLVEAGACAS